ncbi:MAG: hypothetical protein R3Y38_05625 [Rikenellaceae bacterium]
MKKLYIIFTVALVLSSCYKSELTNTTHPLTGQILVDAILFDSALPTNDFTVELDGNIYSSSSNGIATLPDTLSPGTHTIHVYSNGEGTSVKAGIATVDMADNTFLRHDPEHLYFCSQEITVTADAVLKFTASLNQVTGTLHLNLAITEGDPNHIISSYATISGISNTWDCIADSDISSSSSVIAPTITQGASLTKSSDNNYLTATIQTLGASGLEQILTIEMLLIDGRVQSSICDITSYLSTLVADKPTPVIFGGDVSIPTTIEGNMTITPWEEGDGFNGDVFETTNN